MSTRDASQRAIRVTLRVLTVSSSITRAIGPRAHASLARAPTRSHRCDDYFRRGRLVEPPPEPDAPDDPLGREAPEPLAPLARLAAPDVALDVSLALLLVLLREE